MAARMAHGWRMLATSVSDGAGETYAGGLSELGLTVPIFQSG